MQLFWQKSALIALSRRGFRVFDLLLLHNTGGSFEGFTPRDERGHISGVEVDFLSTCKTSQAARVETYFAKLHYLTTRQSQGSGMGCAVFL